MSAAAYWAVRLSCADHLAQSPLPQQVRAGLRLAPGNAAYWLHWADLEEADGQRGANGIERAAEADPYNANVWMHAGLQAEMDGDVAAAEQDLLRAARLSRQYEPRWALANFYLRRGDAEHFWPWAKSALEWSYGDRNLLFQLCWSMQGDASVILDRAIPDDSVVLRDYLRYLLHNHQWPAALAVAQKLEPQASAQDRELLLGYADGMLDQHYYQAALSAWNALCLRKLVRYSPIDPGQGRPLTNGEFAADPLGIGFDWRIARVPGVAAVRNESPSGLRFEFSGEQPENCNLVYQYVPVQPGGRYALRFGYRTEGIEPQTGLAWKVADAATHREIVIPSLELSSDMWTSGRVPFVVPSDSETLRVTLTYRRRPGTVHIEGTAWLRNVGLERLP